MSISLSRPPALRLETPWGQADHVEQVCPGVRSVSTPGHGGFAVLPDVVAKWPKDLRDFVPYAGPGWYEEECDWSVVVAAMPEQFSIMRQAAAVKMLEMMTTRRMDSTHRPGEHDTKYASLIRWLDSPEAKPLLTRVNDWLEANARYGRYQSSSSGTGGHGWRLHWRPYTYQEFGKDLPVLFTFHASYPDTIDLCPTREELVALFGVVQLGDIRAGHSLRGPSEMIARTLEALCETAQTLGWKLPNPMDRSFSSPANQESARNFLIAF